MCKIFLSCVFLSFLEESCFCLDIRKINVIRNYPGAKQIYLSLTPLSNICLKRSCLEEFKSTGFTCVVDTINLTEENDKLLKNFNFLDIYWYVSSNFPLCQFWLHFWIPWEISFQKMYYVDRVKNFQFSYNHISQTWRNLLKRNTCNNKWTNLKRMAKKGHVIMRKPYVQLRSFVKFWLFQLKSPYKPNLSKFEVMRFKFLFFLGGGDDLTRNDPWGTSRGAKQNAILRGKNDWFWPFFFLTGGKWGGGAEPLMGGPCPPCCHCRDENFQLKSWDQSLLRPSNARFCPSQCFK